jgi:alkanesulfonate monooxygenase SsuD/methylene tetrahydromethanopterin reductase-like flavin-dependent oxidoreductase (luciferase family)
MTFDRPIRRTREVVDLVGAFTSGEDAVAYDGEVFEVADFPALSADVPVYNAALGPANRSVTGRYCDGWLPNNVPFSHLATAFETVGEAARETGRDPDAIEVAPWVHVAVDDDDPDAARDAIRATVAYYVGASQGYENAVGAVFPDQAERVATSWRNGEHDGARAAVTDEMVDDLGCAGTAGEARAGLRALQDDPVVDTPIVDVPRGLDDATVERTVEAVAPANR